MSTLNDLQKAWYENDLRNLVTQGKVYTSFVANSDVDGGESLYMAIEVGDDNAVLLGVDLNARGETISFALYRDPTYTGGSQIPVLNLNDVIGVTGNENVTVRNSTINVTDKGSPVFGPWNMYGPTGNNVESIIRNIDVPLVLKSNTTYLLDLANPQGAGNNVETSVAIRYLDN